MRTTAATMQSTITVEVCNGQTYYKAVARSIEYSARINVLGRWEVTTNRLALGRHAGGVKFFASIAEMSEKIRALAGIDQLVNAE